MRVIFLTWMLLFAVGAGRTHEVVWHNSEAEARANGDRFDWQSLGPLDFIEYLQSAYEPDGINIYTVYGYHQDWVQSSDLPELRKIAESDEPCLAVISPFDSHLPIEGSTVGAVASGLLESYAVGGYPARMKKASEAKLGTKD